MGAWVISKGLADSSQHHCPAVHSTPTHCVPHPNPPPHCVPQYPTVCQAPEDSSLCEESEGLNTALQGCPRETAVTALGEIGDPLRGAERISNWRQAAQSWDEGVAQVVARAPSEELFSLWKYQRNRVWATHGKGRSAGGDAQAERGPVHRGGLCWWEPWSISEAVGAPDPGFLEGAAPHRVLVWLELKGWK